MLLGLVSKINFAGCEGKVIFFQLLCEYFLRFFSILFSLRCLLPRLIRLWISATASLLLLLLQLTSLLLLMLSQRMRTTRRR